MLKVFGLWALGAVAGFSIGWVVGAMVAGADPAQVGSIGAIIGAIVGAQAGYRARRNQQRRA